MLYKPLDRARNDLFLFSFIVCQDVMKDENKKKTSQKRRRKQVKIEEEENKMLYKPLDRCRSEVWLQLCKQSLSAPEPECLFEKH